MDKRKNRRLKMLRDQQDIFLKYLKVKFPLFHNSNFFFRDFHYGVKYFLDDKLLPTNYQEAEECAKDFSKTLEEQGIFVKVNDLGWRVNYTDFATVTPGDPF
ncbi:MAG: hypothetical protein K8H86_09465 [Ignavibacteriaceae bacterium]|nr:hypothetical protein [Ignavibacteriaceae bacterium]